MILHDQQIRLSAIRRSLGLTQVELAARMDVPQSTISRWERTGALRAASMERMLSLAREHEQTHASQLPPLRVVAAELAIAILENRKMMQVPPDADIVKIAGLARQVLETIQAQLTHSQ